MTRFYLQMLFMAAGATCAAAQNADISTARIFGDKVIASVADSDGSRVMQYNAQRQLAKTEIRGIDERGTVVYDYTKGEVAGHAYDMTVTSAEVDEVTTMYVTIGSNGYASGCLIIEREYGEDISTEQLLFEYDSDGHLTKITDKNRLYDEVTTLAYKDGDITDVTVAEISTEDYVITYHTALSPTPHANIGKLMIFDTFGVDDSYLSELYYAGVLGEATAHLPVRREDQDVFEQDTHTYKWTLNADGYPQGMQDYDNGKLEDSYTITWTSPQTASTAESEESQHAPSAYYTIGGIHTYNPTRGVVIATYADGTARKTVAE